MKPKLNLKPEVIIKVIADYYHIPVDAMISRSRKQELIKGKHLAIYFIKRNTKLSLAKIGMNFKGKNGSLGHATVIFAEKSVNNQYDTDPKYREQFHEIENLLWGKDVITRKEKRGHFTVTKIIHFQFYYFNVGWRNKVKKPVVRKIYGIPTTHKIKIPKEPFYEPLVSKYAHIEPCNGRPYSGYKPAIR